MRIAVIELNQESPNRHISKARAERFIAREIAKWVTFGKVLRMIKNESEIRQDMKYMPTMTKIVRRNHRVGREGLLLYYPHKDQESYA